MFKVIFDNETDTQCYESPAIEAGARFATREEAHEALKAVGYKKDNSEEDWSEPGDCWERPVTTWYKCAEVGGAASKETCLW